MPPSPTEAETSSERDRELILVGQETAELNQPVVVAGDLNDVAWSDTTRLFRKISSLLDPRIGRGFFSSFHAGFPLIRWPLDHIFHSEHFGLVNIQRLPAIGSDHFPIFIELRLLAAMEDQQDLEPQREIVDNSLDEKEKSIFNDRMVASEGQ